MNTIRGLARIAAKIRVETLNMLMRSGSGYATSCMSVVELMVCIYFAEINAVPVLNVNPLKSQSPDRDFFILGMSQVSPILYSVLAERGFFHKNELLSFGKIDSLLQSCPTLKVSGIDAPVASSFHGLSYAVGIAQSLKLDRKKNKVYCLISDEQTQSGQFWEAVMSASHYNLDNLFLFVNQSRFQTDGPITQVMEVDPLFEKFEYFGWRGLRIVDGHNCDLILNHLSRAWSVSRKPTVLIGRTILGKGIPFAENKAYYYGVPLSNEEIQEVLPSLERIVSS